MSDEHDKKWIPIAEAATETELPVRTIYNWVKSGSISSSKEDGVTSVLASEVHEKARERELAAPKPALLPAAPAGTQLPASDAGTAATRCVEVLPQEARSVLPIELLAYLIRLFEQGMPLQSIVMELRLPTLLVLEGRSVPSKAAGQRFDPFAERFALIGEGEFRALIGERLGDAPGDRMVIGDAHDQASLAVHQRIGHGFPDRVRRRRA